MSILLKILWSKQEQRLRWGWRFLIFVLVIVLSAIPLQFLLVSIFGESDGSSQAQWLSVLTSGGLIALAIWLCNWLVDRRKSLAKLGLQLSALWWREFAIGFFLAVICMAIIFAIEYAFGWLQISAWWTSGAGQDSFAVGFVTAIGLFLMVGFYEELLFRGYLIKNFAESMRFLKIGNKGATLIALLVTSLLFGLAHASNPNANWVSSLNIALAGLFLGLAYVLTNRLALPIGFHIAWNFFQGNVFGFPVSGTQAGATVIQINQGGPTLWTGGAFGPEAGLLSVILVIISCLVVVGYARTRANQSLEAVADFPAVTGETALR
jgi:membrane protease YdiL (CAAX protease family)